ncbi:AAA family ATPase [Rhizobium ruizarguesonis]
MPGCYLGPPGTGKTLFASALATALGVRLVSVTVGAWQSAGALDDMLAAMRKTFENVNDGRGAVLFIDEIDAIGKRLARTSGNHNDQYWQVVVTDFFGIMEQVPQEDFNQGHNPIVCQDLRFPTDRAIPHRGAVVA